MGSAATAPRATAIALVVVMLVLALFHLPIRSAQGADAPSFVLGVNMNGGAVTIEGNA